MIQMSGNKNIVLIDDDPMFNLIHSKIINFADPDIAVFIFEDALLALEQLITLDTSGPGLLRFNIFLDINMPALDGWGFIERFSTFPPSVLEACHVFMLSSSNDRKDINKAGSYPLVKGFISKPLSVQHVLDISSGTYSSIEHRFAGLSKA